MFGVCLGRAGVGGVCCTQLDGGCDVTMPCCAVLWLAVFLVYVCRAGWQAAAVPTRH